MAARPHQHTSSTPELDDRLSKITELARLVESTSVEAPIVTKRALVAAAPLPRTARVRRLVEQRARTARRRVHSRRFVKLGVALAAVMVAGGAALTAASGAPAPADPLANSVRAVAGAPDLGPATGMRLNASIADMAARPQGDGYWLAAADGGVFGFGQAQFHGSAAGQRLAAPVVGIAATPSGNGYWLVAADGGVFSFGDAPFEGSIASRAFSTLAPIVAIESTPSGHGYWLTSADGGVFTFGDAQFEGAAVAVHHGAPVVAMAPTPSGYGYYLLSADGGVFAFGDARFQGAPVDGTHVATGIVLGAGNRGYQVSRSDGAVVGFGGAASIPAPIDLLWNQHPTVALASTGHGGIWLASSYSPPPPPVQDLSQDPFLKCTRAHESDSAGGYQARSSDGLYHGAYQFLQSTWNNVARAMGRLDLVGVDPANAAPADQDAVALYLYHHAGAGPWGGRCAGLP